MYCYADISEYVRTHRERITANYWKAIAAYGLMHSQHIYRVMESGAWLGVTVEALGLSTAESLGICQLHGQACRNPQLDAYQLALNFANNVAGRVQSRRALVERVRRPLGAVDCN